MNEYINNVSTSNKQNSIYIVIVQIFMQFKTESFQTFEWLSEHFLHILAKKYRNNRIKLYQIQNFQNSKTLKNFFKLNIKIYEVVQKF